MLFHGEPANYVMNPIRTGSLIDALVVKISVRSVMNMPINYIMVCVGGVILNVINAINHVRKGYIML